MEMGNRIRRGELRATIQEKKGDGTPSFPEWLEPGCLKSVPDGKVHLTYYHNLDVSKLSEASQLNTIATCHPRGPAYLYLRHLKSKPFHPLRRAFGDSSPEILAISTILVISILFRRHSSNVCSNADASMTSQPSVLLNSRRRYCINILQTPQETLYG